MKKITLYLALAGILSACEIKPAEIVYGTDACHFCSMTIVDPGHASQYVTDKGKAFKFDSIECLYRDLREENPETSLILVADFTDPGQLIAADKAYYLVDPSVPSPMGENLSAFKDSLSASEFVTEGKVSNWSQLKLD